ncbi:MAG: beta-lactamase/transpeptidase-like protein [Linnemannia gamsii]|nr:MAG: beta-lactamase/transpeptidase-like protein [Linnemannia gamsii]
MKLSLLLLVATALEILVSIEGLPVEGRLPLLKWREALELARNKTGLPGMSVAVLHKGKLIFAEGFGKRNRNDPVTAETLMPIGSMTKAMTAAAIGELVAEGKLDWDTTPVSKYVPEAQFGDPILTSELTLADYLSHRSGLPHDDTPWVNVTATRSEIFRRLKHMKLTSKLGTKLQYSNIGYTIAGEAAANAAGIPYEKLVEAKVFRPLGLSNTGFSPVEMGKRPNHGMHHYADSFQDAQQGRFHEGYLDESFKLLAPAGDIYSNVLDLVTWGRTIMHHGELDGKQILNKESVIEQLRARTIYRSERSSPEFAPSSAYGMGWFMDSYKGQAMYYHGGNVIGFTSNIVLFPDSDLVVAVLSNLFAAMLPNNVPYYLADEILDLPRTQDWMGDVVINRTIEVYRDIAEKNRGTFPPRIKNRPTTHPLHQYTGAYFNPLFGNVSVTLATSEASGIFNKGLHIQFQNVQSSMEHYHFDSFVYIVDLWSVKSRELLTFTTGKDGKIEGFQIEYLDEVQVFSREKKEERSGGCRGHEDEDEDVEEMLIWKQDSSQYRI